MTELSRLFNQGRKFFFWRTSEQGLKEVLRINTYFLLIKEISAVCFHVSKLLGMSWNLSGNRWIQWYTRVDIEHFDRNPVISDHKLWQDFPPGIPLSPGSPTGWPIRAPVMEITMALKDMKYVFITMGAQLICVHHIRIWRPLLIKWGIRYYMNVPNDM